MRVAMPRLADSAACGACSDPAGGAELVGQYSRLGFTVLGARYNHLEQYFQVIVVQTRGPGEHYFGHHARLKSFGRGKDDILTAHPSGLGEAMDRSVLGCGFVAQR
jgi:hypothetical protein